jgi:predicted nucleic acid-binding protein
VIVVDSSVWIDYFNGLTTSATEKLHALLGTETLAVGDLILTEVLQGFRKDSDYKVAKDLMTALTVFDMLGHQNAIKCADNFRALRKRGITVRRTVDVVIATFCVERNLPLLFQDRHFLPFVEHMGLRAVAKGT